MSVKMLKYLIATFFLIVSPAIADPAPKPMSWVEVDQLFYTTSPSRLYGPGNLSNPAWPYTAVYVITKTGAIDYGPQEQNTWHLFDLRPFGVGEDAKVAFLAGLAIITHGTSEEIADGYLAFREPGDTSVSCDWTSPQSSPFIVQAIEASTNAGQRSTFSTWVPLIDGQGEFCYHLTTPGSYPSHSAYGFNASVQVWGK